MNEKLIWLGQNYLLPFSATKCPFSAKGLDFSHI